MPTYRCPCCDVRHWNSEHGLLGYCWKPRCREMLAEKERDLATARRMSRKSDPDTSKDATRSMVGSGQVRHDQERVLALVVAYPNRTARELARDAGLFIPNAGGKVWCEAPSILKRLVELERSYHVDRQAPRPCRVTGRKAATWKAWEDANETS